MPPRNDESRFEQVLARHLRRPGTSGLGGETRAGCPDAETLAAYHERALSAEEMDTFKVHIAACERCQEVLAGVEASEAVAVGEREDARVAAAQAAERELGIEATPRSVEAARAKSRRIWKWTAPAAAAAAGLLVWVGVQQTRNVPSETTTVAVNTPSGASDSGRPLPAAEEPISTQSSDERANLAEKRAQAVASARQGARLPDGQGVAAPLPSEQSGARMESDGLTAQLSTDRERKLDQKTPRQDESAKTNSYSFSQQPESKVSAMTTQAPGGEQAASSKQKTAPSPAEQFGMEGGQKEAERQFAAEDAPAKPSEYRAGELTAMEKTKRTIPEEEQKQALADKDVGRVSADAVEANARGPANRRGKRAAREFAKPAAAPPAALMLRDGGAVFAKSAPGLVLAPDKSVLWRVGPGGMILKSLDGGVTWNPQASGVSAELLAGSAPSEKVCWVVGRGGIILRTTDGEHWERIPSPSKTDLIAIEARDAQTAVVWTAEKLPKYVTRDAGKTWQPMPE